MLEVNNKRMCSFCFSTLMQGTDSCPVCGSMKKIRTMPEVLPCGTILHGRYVLGKTLGKGGFSITYTAYDSRTDSVVAVKEFFPSDIAKRNADGIIVTARTNKEEAVYKQGMKHFYEEAQILSSLRHPNIVNIYNLYSENGTVYYTMEYLRGSDLRQFVNSKGGKIKEEDLIPIIACVAEALQTVHENRLLHRDIAPDNIFLSEDGTVKLIDFGAAKDIGISGNKSFSIILKQGFAPMEQYQRRGNQGPWTDIYALGSTMYYCLNGKMPPFAAERINDPVLKIECSDNMALLISDAMALKPEDRIRSIKEFKQRLFSVICSLQTSSETEEMQRHAESERKSNITAESEKTDDSVKLTGYDAVIKSYVRRYSEIIKAFLNKIPLAVKIIAGIIIVLIVIIIILSAGM